jgi:hypothetical protein
LKVEQLIAAVLRIRLGERHAIEPKRLRALKDELRIELAVATEIRVNV